MVNATGLAHTHTYTHTHPCLVQMSIQLEKAQQSLEKQLQEKEEMAPHHDLIG